MTIVSNDPTLWPTINIHGVSSYFAVAAFVGVSYDWVLTFGREVELIWRQRWSLITALYLSVRYLGILLAILSVLSDVGNISLTDTKCFTMYVIQIWTSVLVFPMLGVIIITRLHAMYQRSRKILIFLIVTFLAVNIFEGVVAVLMTMHVSAEKPVLSDTYQCSVSYPEDISHLDSITWILSTVWEVLALCLAVRIAVKHFHELRPFSAGRIMEDCFMVLMKTHVLYFASFVAVSCFQLITNFSPTLSTENSLDTLLYAGFLEILTVVQMFLLGPRLILSIREYHAKLVVDSDSATGMTSMAFQERVRISTSGSV